MIAAGVGGAAGMIGLPWLFYVIFRPTPWFWTFEGIVTYIVLGLSPFVGAFCAVRASALVDHFLNRDDDVNH